jgi:uncharacterized Fe-S cluster protein YjdI
MSDIVKEYKREDITIVWKPKLCIHAEVCVNSLPEVYRPGEKPWIRQDNAGKDELIDQINGCPSGALSYILNK